MMMNASYTPSQVMGPTSFISNNTSSRGHFVSTATSPTTTNVTVPLSSLRISNFAHHNKSYESCAHPHPPSQYFMNGINDRQPTLPKLFSNENFQQMPYAYGKTSAPYSYHTQSQTHSSLHNSLPRPNSFRPSVASVPSSASSVLYGSRQSSPTQVSSTPTSKRNCFPKKCDFPMCKNSSRSRGYCYSHGGGRRCRTPGCTNGAVSRDLCKRHGGGRRCKIAGCKSSSESGGLCYSHGGGRRCLLETCSARAKKGGYCALHVDYPKNGAQERSIDTNNRQHSPASPSQSESSSPSDDSDASESSFSPKSANRESELKRKLPQASPLDIVPLTLKKSRVCTMDESSSPVASPSDSANNSELSDDSKQKNAYAMSVLLN